MCSPGDEYAGVTDMASHHFSAVIDRNAAFRQHRELTKLFESFGCAVIDCPELAGHPNSVFTRDTAVCTPSGFIRPRMGLDTRRGEEVWMADNLVSHGVPCAGAIHAPGTLEGGDVILAGDVAFVGLSSRTNADGASQVSELLRCAGYEIRTATVPEPYLHIGGAMSVIAPRRILACRGVFPDRFFRGFDALEIECDSFASGNVICLGDGEIIVDAAHEVTAALLEADGCIVHRIDLSEFVKGMGGPTCLILPVERE